MGARSVGHSVACSDFIPTAYLYSMTWGNMACYNLDADKEMAATDREARAGRGQQCAEL
jgi:hypothetical protein